MKRLRAPLFISCVVVATTLFVGGVTASGVSLWLRGTWLFLGGAIAILLIIWRANVKRYPPKPGELSEFALTTRIDGVLNRSLQIAVTDDQLGLLNYFLLYPNSARARVVETLDLRSERIVKQSTMLLRLPSGVAASGATLIVPVLRPVKGRDIAQLRVSDASGLDLPTWGHEESLPVLAHLLEMQLRKSFKVAPRHALSKDQSKLLMLAIEIMLRADRRDRHRTTLRDRERELAGKQIVEYANVKGLEAVNAKRWQEFETLVRLLSCNYIVLASIPAANRFAISFSYSMPTREHIREQSDGSVSDLRTIRASFRSVIRRLSQTEPGRVRVSVNKGNSCESYHLDVIAPNRAHIGAMRLLDENGKFIRKDSSPPYDLDNGYFRVSGKGTGTAHLYSRRLNACRSRENESGGQPPAFLELATVETPPGALGRALLVAGLTVVLVFITGYRATQISEFNIDTLALFGGVLGAFLLVVGFVRGSEAGGMRVIAILALGSMALSLSIMGLSAVLVSTRLGVEAGSFIWPDDISLAGLTSWPWVLCAVASLVNLCWTLSALVTRLLRHQNLTQPKPGQTDSESVQA